MKQFRIFLSVLRTVTAWGVATSLCLGLLPPAGEAQPLPGGAGEAPPPAAPRRTIADVVGLAAGPAAGKEGEFFQRVRDLGVTRIRPGLLWSVVQRDPHGSFHFEKLDPIVNGARNGRPPIDVLGILGYGVWWASGKDKNKDDSQFYPPDNVNDFVAYAKAVVQHYDGRVFRYEVWNEPNFPSNFWKSKQLEGGDPAAFGTLVEKTIEGIKGMKLKHPPQIAPGGTAFLFTPLTRRSGPDFMRDAFASNKALAGRIDAFAFHAYNAYPPAKAPESGAIDEVQLGDKIAKMRGVLKDAGMPPNRPLWITEIGWPTLTLEPLGRASLFRNVDEDQQARWLVRVVLVAALNGVEEVYLYTLQDDPKAFIEWEKHFGLLDDNGKPKKSYVAVKTLLAHVGPYAIVSRVKVPGAPRDVYAVELERGDGSKKKAWAAWRTNDDDIIVSAWEWTLPRHGAARVVGIDGRDLGPAGAKVSLTVDPLYIVER